MTKIICILFFLFSTTLIYSQLELKPAIGINSSRFDSDPDSLLAKSRTGFQAGASLVIGRKMYVEPGIFYTKLSQNFTPVNTDKSEFKYGASFLRIPVNLGFLFIGHNTSLAGLKIYVGPSMFIPLSVKENSYMIEKADLKNPQFDFSVGAGLNIWLFFLDVSYGWGITPQFKADPIEAKMQAFYANLGFRFKLKHEEE